MQTTFEVGGGNARVGNIYFVLSAQAPAALDALRAIFRMELPHTRELLGVWFRKHLRLDNQFTGAVSEQLYHATAVTIVWVFEKLTALQQSALSIILTPIQAEIPGICEPGWWLWDGTTAKCMPWGFEADTPNVIGDLGRFARSTNASYTYPWS